MIMYKFHLQDLPLLNCRVKLAVDTEVFPNTLLNFNKSAELNDLNMFIKLKNHSDDTNFNLLFTFDASCLTNLRIIKEPIVLFIN